MHEKWNVKVFDPRLIATGDWQELLKQFGDVGDFDEVAQALGVSRLELDRIDVDGCITEDGAPHQVVISKLKLYLLGMEEGTKRLVDQGLLEL